MSEKPFTILVLVLLALAITFYLRSESSPTQTITAAGAQIDNFGPAPDLSLPIGKDHQHVELSSLHGKVVVLDFWATWCGPCQMSIPGVEAMYRNHKAEGLEVVGVSLDEPGSRKEVDSTVRALGMTYPIALINDIPDAKTKYEFVSIPLMIIIDKKGIVRARISGYDGTNHEDLVAKLLKEPT